MATYEISDPSGQKFQITAPDSASQDDVLKYAQSNMGKPSDVNPLTDLAKSAPRAAIQGVLDATSGPPVPDSPIPIPPELMQGSGPQIAALENMGGPSYQPQTGLGQIGASAIRTAANPLSYVGPGSIGLKLGGALLSGGASEAAGQATAGTPYEIPARLAAGVVGGIGAAKTLGPTAERAAIPTAPELKVAEDKLYNSARNSGVEFAPSGLKDFAAQAEQKLTTGDKYAFTGGPDGTAPKTLGLLGKIQSPPEGATVTASNLDTLRRQINNIAGETKDFKPTPDAKAAMVLKQEFANYLEHPPQGHVVAGNAENFVRNITEANATHAALSRLNAVDARVEKAGNQTNRQISGSLDARIKSTVGGMLDNPKSLRGFNPQEKAQVQLINDGTPGSNILRQLGRGGAGVIPLGTHIGAAAMTGGASIPASIAIGAPLYAARKISELMTISRAKKLADMLAMRSPLYEQRLAGLPRTDMSPNVAAVARGLLGGLR